MPEATDPRTDYDLRAEVVHAGRVLAANGHSDMVWGHVSIRDPHGRGLWVKRSGLGFEELASEDVQLLDHEGELVDGMGSPHLERYIHTEIMRRRLDVGCVIHTHPEAATTFAATGMRLLAIAHEATMFGPDDIARFTETGDLIRSAELGQRVAEALADRDALLLVNHGVVVTGPTVAEAVFAAVLLEKACRMQLAAAAAVGADRLICSPPDEARAKRDRCYSPTQQGHGWGYLSRQEAARSASSGS